MVRFGSVTEIRFGSVRFGKKVFQIRFGSVRWKKTRFGRFLLETLFGLAFVPVEDVLTAWDLLKSQMSPSTTAAADAFLQYFQSTWILSAVYPIKMWNMHQTVIDGGPRTNNHSEGNNNALARFIGCSNPSGGLLAEALTQFNQQAEIHIEHCLTGTVSGARKRKEYRDNDDRIKKAITNYGLVGTALYCRSLSRLD